MSDAHSAFSTQPPSSVAQHYAQALFDVVQSGQDGVSVETVRDALSQWASDVVTQPEWTTLITSPAIPVAEKRALLTELAEKLESPLLVVNLVNILLDNGRLYDLAGVAEAFAALYRKANQLGQAVVESAVPFPEHLQDSLRRALANRFGFSDVQLSVTINPALLAGAIVRLNDQVIDGSFATQLTSIKAAALR